LFINYYLIIVLLKQEPAAHRVHLPSGRRATTHTAHSARNGLRANCPDFVTQDQWPPNLPNINPANYRVGCNVGGLLQV